MPCRVPAVAVLFALALAGCSGGVPTAADLPSIAADAKAGKTPALESDARRAVRETLRRVMDVDAAFDAELGRLFGRHELRSYFLTSESFVGGTWPAGTAKLLREVERLEMDYLVDMDVRALLSIKLAQSSLSEAERKKLEDEVIAAIEAERRPLAEATEAHLEFVRAAAVLYEMVAAQPDDVKAMRTGLEISDDGLHSRFNDQVDVVNAAADRAQAASDRLNAQAKAARQGLGLERRAR